MLDRMLRKKPFRLGIVCLIAVGFAAMLPDYGAAWPRYAAAAWCVAFGWAYLRAVAVGQRDRLQSSEADYHRRLIDTLHHYRHDWMNDLQILFGYAKLKKYEQLVPSMERIRDRLMTESALSRLGDASLIAFLIDFRIRNRCIDFKVISNLEQALAVTPGQSRFLSRLVVAVLESYRDSILETWGEPSELLLQIDWHHGLLQLSFEFTGHYREELLELKLKKMAEQFKLPDVPELETDLSREAADVFVRIPIAN